MTFQELLLECIDLGVCPREVKPAQLKKWINAAELEVWDAGEWSFKRRPASSTVAITAGQSPRPPVSDFAKAYKLYDPRGGEVPYLAPDEFERNYVAPVPQPAGSAEAYTVIDRRLYVGPTETGTFTLSYRRRYCHLDVGGLPVVGTMLASTDSPIWDAEHHYLLVPWALLIGGRFEPENARERLADDRDRLLGTMKHDLANPGVDGALLQYG